MIVKDSYWHVRIPLTFAIIWVILSTAMFAYLYTTIADTQKRAEAQVTQLESTGRGGVAQTVLGCQRGNEIRRALATLTSEADLKNHGIDPDATEIDDCRETTLITRGFDPGPVGNFVDDKD